MLLLYATPFLWFRRRAFLRGTHYPTDILARAAIGCRVALAANNEPLRSKIAGLLDFALRRPAIFYACIPLDP
jgi:hypothetical protein